MDFFDMMRSYRGTPAMEADDITDEVNAEKNKSGGSKEPEDDMTNTKDIFGVGDTDTDNEVTDTNQASEDTPDNTVDNPDDTNDDGGDDDGDFPDMGDGPSDDSSDTNDGSGDDGSMDDGMGDDAPDEEDAPEIDKLSVLRDNMVQFHAMVSGNLKLISENTPDIIPEQSSNLTNVITNLRECKNSMYTLIVTKFKEYPYEKLLSAYVAIQRAYQLTVVMLEKYFDQLDIVDEEREKQKLLREKKASKKANAVTKK